MNTDDMELWNNQLIEIECEDGSVYFTQIIRMSDASMYVRNPVDTNNEPLPHHLAGAVSVYFYDGKDKFVYDSAVSFEGPRVSLTKPRPDFSDVQRVQRRNFFRIPAEIEVWIEAASGENAKYVTVDISGGGIAFYEAEDRNEESLYRIGDDVIGHMYLEDKNGRKHISFGARVVDLRTGPGGRRRVSVAFTEIKEPLRSEIVRYCIRKQLRARTAEQT